MPFKKRHLSGDNLQPELLENARSSPFSLFAPVQSG
jgi:hypothetical protein